MQMHRDLFHALLWAAKFSDPDHEIASERVSTAIPTTKSLPEACPHLRATVSTVAGGCRELAATVDSVVRAWKDGLPTVGALRRDRKDVLATVDGVASGFIYRLF